MYPTEIKITNFSPLANLHRNLNRPVVDFKFEKADMIYNKLMNANVDLSSNYAQQQFNLIEQLDFEARQIWRDIVTISNSL